MRAALRPYFSDIFYRKHYRYTAGLGPLRHYIIAGWRLGYDPCDWFSTTGYLELNDDIQSSTNPFYHYLVHGRLEGRPLGRIRGIGAPQPNALQPLIVPPVPAAQAWERLAPRRIDTPASVTVIVPVYKSLSHVAATLWSVLEAESDTPFQVLVIDDASPEPEVSALLAMLAELGLIRLVINRRNLGFVASVNRGFARSRGRDVVILNADTVVSDHWLDRLLAPLADDPSIATVTPLSNNATIASYPIFAADNAFELEAPVGALSDMATAVNGRAAVDIPTGVGFCMAIRGGALADVGGFDQRAFGLGYGEECDFCMRALKKGWRNVLATGVYVRHFGAASFGDEAAARSADAQRRLAAKHPDYDERVRFHVRADPALPGRMLLDAARLAHALGGVSVIFITHTRGGGIATYLDYMRRTLIRDGLLGVADRALVIALCPGGAISLSAFKGQPLPYCPNLAQLNVGRHRSILGKLFRTLAPDLIHVNSFAGLTADEIGAVTDGVVRSGRPFWHVWHDHQALTPQLTFLDSENRYLGEDVATLGGPSFQASAMPIEWVCVEAWQAMFRDYLAHASVISAPTEAAAKRARRVAPVGKVAVHPHPEPLLQGVAKLCRVPRAQRHVLILGAIGAHKGAHLVWAMVRDARERGLPLHFHIVGYSAQKQLKTGRQLTVHGRYGDDMEAIATITEIQPDVCFQSSIWPETYVFTLSVAMALALPTVSFDMGAQGERVGAYGRGALLPAILREDPCAVNDALLAADLDRLWGAPADAQFATQSALSQHFLGAGLGKVHGREAGF